MRTLRSDLRGDGHGGGRGPQARVGTGDELAHTNIPGSVHEKRWQSVDDILAAGINVISTVNVQHFERLNDTVFEITGVRVRETLPDSVLDRADEVVLVDLTADALINLWGPETPSRDWPERLRSLGSSLPVSFPGVAHAVLASLRGCSPPS